ncbi:hypothetical protein BC834DRAFT_974597 [Gloeopeniophorella convolvens]|nr:hypothetical protein BC834DRAFT_974597 [Gloeopeniophorella convolvens]
MSTIGLRHTHLRGPDKLVPRTYRSSTTPDDAEQIISHNGTSQYSKGGSGTAACGLAALNFARLVFSKENEGLKDTALLQAVLAREFSEETTGICTLWSDNLHLEVEDICRVPLFEKTLKLRGARYEHPSFAEFEALLTRHNTRPPEILACLKLRVSGRSTFVIFDSHPRPSLYPNGAGLIVNQSVEHAARRLAELLPSIDFSDSDLQWQAQLLANFSAHVFVSCGHGMSTEILWQAVVESSLTQLSMQAEIANLKIQTRERERLEQELEEAEERIRQQEKLIKRLQSSHGDTTKPRTPSYIPRPPSSPQTSHRHSTTASPSSTKPPHTFAATSPFADSQPSHIVRSGTPASPADSDSSLSFAVRLQQQFNAEDRALSAQRAQLSKHIQRVFECGVCMEEMPEDSITRLDPCSHAFCRDCVRTYVASCLKSHKFPILCPTCTAGKGKGKGEVGQVSQPLALDLGLTDEQYSIWTEMEMVTFSVLLSCRKCQRSMFVARDEHDEARILACPLPDCNYAWCKQCQQGINFDGPQHSCDGTSELDHLMKQNGWKYCPTCNTPIQKIDGCNHMSCMAAACNTHFCYLCGDLIARSALGPEIKVAVSKHFSKKCLLFEIPD